MRKIPLLAFVPHFAPIRAGLLAPILLLLLRAAPLFGNPPALETGEIAGAKFTIARPAQWNKNILLIAHGLRTEDRPLVADLFPDQLAIRTLLDEGWLVAKTGYRRNGIIVVDALADLDALRTYIARNYGEPDRVILEGESMGGLIVTLAAEREPALYSGAIAIGAALQVRENNSTLGLSLSPKIPLLFLTNQSELDGPVKYTAAVTAHAASTLPKPVFPIVLRVARNGHVNVNQRERLLALRTLVTWLDHGPATLPRPGPNEKLADATVPPAPQPAQVTAHPDARGFDAHVTEISAVYGNVFLDAQPADFAAAGILGLTWFELTAHGQTYRTRLGTDFSSVKKSEWVVFPNADGFTWLSRNYADAAATAALRVGDLVTLRRYNEPAK